MANQYQEMKQRQQEEFHAFPCFFAFSDAQFAEGMKKLGLKPTDTRKVCAGLGGMIYRKTDSPKLVEMMERFGREQDEAIAADATGEGFIYDMFEYELSNHEYTYTRSVSAAITACGFTAEQVMGDPRLKHGLEKACTDLWNWYVKNG